MSLATRAPETTATATTAPVLDVVVPVYNEENDLAPCVRKLHAHLTQRFPHSFRITIADNASTDGTADRRRTGGRAERGAGGAPRREGPGPCAQGGVVHIGRRRTGVHGRRPVHGPRRSASPGGGADLRSLRHRDRQQAGAQCGFKAIRAEVARGLLPHVEDTGWFFDTELLVLAERAGLRVLW